MQDPPSESPGAAFGARKRIDGRPIRQIALVLDRVLDGFDGFPTLENLARTAVFLASDGAGAMTGAIANLTCGLQLD